MKYLYFKYTHPLHTRLVPFAAICCGNLIHIPGFRSNELMNGIPVYTKDGKRVGESKTAAMTGTFLLILTRIGMAAPAMVLVPLLTNAAINRCIFCPFSRSIFPFQLSLVALCWAVATPLCYAVFGRKPRMPISCLEPNLKTHAQELAPNKKAVYYKNGL
ncbi:hypothetical protein PYW07_010099 [Mythimna separata]|uniref:Uncharacterized protein n=1 Tax=Mythimna separata TaxID=271217 RepID=A0AAD7YHD6_MYTSE|nr:hypothetical protein PYW07_010099 [Mythimna separata]